jgi:hypothetical protein
MTYFNLCGINSTYSNISKGEKGVHIKNYRQIKLYVTRNDDTISFSFKTLFFNLNNELDLTFLNY